MESTFSITKEQVFTRPSLLVALAKVVAAAGTPEYEDLVNDMACEALTLYHDLGRTDVDNVGVGIGSDMSMEADFALDDGARGEVLFNRLMGVIIDLAGNTYGQ